MLVENVAKRFSIALTFGKRNKTLDAGMDKRKWSFSMGRDERDRTHRTHDGLKDAKQMCKTKCKST